MTHDNTAEPTTRRASHPLAVLGEDGTPLWCAIGGEPVYHRDEALEALWRARTMHNYPHYDDLSPTDQAQSEPLRIPYYAEAVTPPAERAIKRATQEVRRHVKNDARYFTSRYIGVTRTQGHYVGQWRNERGTYSRGPRRPDTPAGELQAAWDWARATGKTALEER